MLFHLALFVALAGAGLHIFRLSSRGTAKVGEVILLWVLVGYCGVPMMGFVGYGILYPDELARITGFPPDSPFQTFTTWALLGMALASTLSLRFRGTYLIGPAIAWAVFFVGATAIHLSQSGHAGAGHAGALTHSNMLMILATHGLISVILLVSLGMSGVWRAQR